MMSLTNSKSLLRWIDAIEAEIESDPQIPVPNKIQAKLLLAGADKHARNAGFLDKCCRWIPGAHFVVAPLLQRENRRCSTLIRRSALMGDLNPTFLMPSKVLKKKPS